MTQAVEKNEFRRRMEDLLADIEREQTLPIPGPFEEGPDQLILEHGTRRLFFDRFLALLGWGLGAAGDVAEEVRIKAETTTFIDYVGVNDATRAPVLILEAKAWDKAFISAARGKPNATGKQLIISGIEHVNLGPNAGSSPVILAWLQHLEQVAGYVKDARARYKHDVPCAVLASGQWIVVFTNPVRTFCDGIVDEDDIQVFLGQDFSEKAERIFELLSRERLAAIAPEHIRPTQVSQYLSLDQVTASFRAVLVTYSSRGSSIFHRMPEVLVYPALLLQRSDGLLFTVVDDDEPARLDMDTVQDGQGEPLLVTHVGVMDTRAAALLETCEAELGGVLALSPVDDFPGFNGKVIEAAPGAAALQKTYVRPLRKSADEWFIVTGQNAHFLLDRPSLACRFHSWSASREVRKEFGTSAVGLPSIADPRAFFTDGAHHHCSHRTIIDRRERTCFIAPLDRRLCCRACGFQTICWTDAERAAQPCGTSG